MCANGQLGYGRRKRSSPSEQPDLNKVYEVSMATVVKVAYEPVDEKPRVWVEKGNTNLFEKNASHFSKFIFFSNPP